MDKNLVVTLGCRLNYWESNKIYQLLKNSKKKNFLVFNTCSVTNEAIKNSIKKIKFYSKKFPNTTIVVTGCGVESDYELFKSLPEVSEVVGNHEKLSEKNWSFIKTNTGEAEGIKIEKYTKKENPSNSNVRKFVKIQSGCDHSCTFCIIPSCRGGSISQKTSVINKEISENLNRGVKEIILTGVDITAWGQDFKKPEALGNLLENIFSNNKNLKRLRLSSIDAAEFDDRLLDLIKNEKRLMPHFHFSLQSLDDMILKRMKRRHNVSQTIELIEKIRKFSSSSTFGADFITGFPTETEKMFYNTYNLVKKLKISHLHVFPYSAKDGTKAARMPQLPVEVRRERAKELRRLGKENFLETLKLFVKKKHAILVEDNNGRGKTENNLPVDVNLCEKGNIFNYKPTKVNKEKLCLY